MSPASAMPVFPSPPSTLKAAALLEIVRLVEEKGAVVEP